MFGYMIAWLLHEIIEPLCTLLIFGYLVYKCWKGVKRCVRHF